MRLELTTTDLEGLPVVLLRCLFIFIMIYYLNGNFLEVPYIFLTEKISA